MKALIGSLVAFPVGFLLLLVIPIVGGADYTPPASACSPTGGSSLQVKDGQIAPWGPYSAAQMTNAAIIVRVGAQRNIPPRGQQIALMTAIDESGLIPKKQHGMSPTNPETAWGLFQQTPKYGWGTLEQVMDPVYATNAFYSRLVKVKGWATMNPPTLAAHAVQRNRDPYVYQQFWDDAAALLQHLTGGKRAGGTGVARPVAATVDLPTSARTAAEKDPKDLGRIRVVQANIKYNLPRGSFNSDLSKVVAQAPDFISLNEQGLRSDAQITPAGYALQRNQPPAGLRSARAEFRSTAVLWRTDRWRKVAGGAVVLVEDGPRKTDRGRAATWATLANADGAVVSIVSIHQMVNPAHIGPNVPRRRQLYAAGMDRGVALINELKGSGPVITMGDFNSQYRANDPWGPRAKLGLAGLKASFDVSGPVSTHDGGGILDYVFVPADARVVAQRTISLISDHHGVLVDVDALAGGSAPLPAVYCDTAGASTDNGGGGFVVNAAVKRVGPYDQAELIARAKRFAAGGGGWFQRCQNFVAQLAGRPNSGYYSAATAMATFRASGVFHDANSVDGHAPPIGAWLYYTNAGNPYGHVVTYLGNGQVAGTDTWRKDYVDVGPASDITDGRWHLTYEGWAVPWATSGNDVPVKAPLAGRAAPVNAGILQGAAR